MIQIKSEKRWPDTRGRIGSSFITSYIGQDIGSGCEMIGYVTSENLL